MCSSRTTKMYPVSWAVLVLSNCWMAIPIAAMLRDVRSHARNVRSFARWSLAVLILKKKSQKRNILSSDTCSKYLPVLSRIKSVK